MCSLESFKIDLKGLKCEKTLLEFNLDDNYFEAINAPEVKKGAVKVCLSIRKMDNFFEMTFDTKGLVTIPCDRCLDDMIQKIETKNHLIVKFGEEYSEDDDLVTISEIEGIVDVSWFVYQFIVLNIPIQHVHAPGKCNPAMLEVLNQHLATRSSEKENDDTIDPRWSELIKLKNNN